MVGRVPGDDQLPRVGDAVTRAHCQAPIKSQLIRSVGLVGPLKHESTNHIQGIEPIPFRVRPEPRRPDRDCRSPIFAGRQQEFSCACLD